MKIRWNHRYVQLGVTAFLVIAASILFYYGIFHMKSLITGIKTFFGIMAPIIYGAAIAYPYHLEGQALHAMILGFVHPRTGEYMEFTAPLPEYFVKLLTKLRK